jgi:hypothetical protein
MDLCVVSQFVTCAGLMYGSVKSLISHIVIGHIYISIHIGEMVGRSVCWPVKWSSVNKHCTNKTPLYTHFSKGSMRTETRLKLGITFNVNLKIESIVAAC